MSKFLEFDAEIVLQKMNTTREQLWEGVRLLQDWLKTQPHIPPISDEKLRTMFIFAKLSMEKTKRRVDMHYTVRTLIPELFQNWDPLSPELLNISDTCLWITTRKLTPKAERVCILRVVNENPDRFNPWEFFKWTFMLGELRMVCDYAYGEQIIYDLQAVKLGHIMKLTPALLKKVNVVGTEGYGVKIAGIHFMNAPAAIDRLLPILKMLLKPKIYDRIHIHKSVESLHKCIPKDILPAEYGGNEPSIVKRHEDLVELMKQQRQFFLNEMKLRVDESKRPEKINVDELFGSIHGSFRQLAVD